MQGAAAITAAAPCAAMMRTAGDEAGYDRRFCLHEALCKGRAFVLGGSALEPRCVAFVLTMHGKHDKIIKVCSVI